MGKEKNKQNRGNTPQDQDVEDKKAREKVKEIVLQVHIHCEGCAKKVSRCLQGFDGVEEVKIDRTSNKVTVKGEKADPSKVFERIRKKYSRNVELLSPKPKVNGGKDKKVEQPKTKEPQAKVMILRMHMHCEGCVRDVKKNIAKMEGVCTVDADMSKSQVTVKGVFDPQKLAETITKRLGKHVDIVKEEKAVNSDKSNKGNRMDHPFNHLINYPPQYPFNSNIYSCQILSDENPFSCFIM